MREENQEEEKEHARRTHPCPPIYTNGIAPMWQAHLASCPPQTSPPHPGRTYSRDALGIHITTPCLIRHLSSLQPVQRGRDGAFALGVSKSFPNSRATARAAPSVVTPSGILEREFNPSVGYTLNVPCLCPPPGKAAQGERGCPSELLLTPLSGPLLFRAGKQKRGRCGRGGDDDETQAQHHGRRRDSCCAGGGDGGVLRRRSRGRCRSLNSRRAVSACRPILGADIVDCGVRVAQAGLAILRLPTAPEPLRTPQVLRAADLHALPRTLR